MADDARLRKVLPGPRAVAMLTGDVVAHKGFLERRDYLVIHLDSSLPGLRRAA